MVLVGLLPRRSRPLRRGGLRICTYRGGEQRLRLDRASRPGVLSIWTGRCAGLSTLYPETTGLRDARIGRSDEKRTRELAHRPSQLATQDARCSEPVRQQVDL